MQTCLSRRFSPGDQVRYKIAKRTGLRSLSNPVEVWYYTKEKVAIKIHTGPGSFVVKYVDEEKIGSLEGNE
jgi:hypothetical protein